MSRYIVGLTGGIGSGKSAVTERFQREGIDVVDTDTIAHELTAPGGAAMPALREAFGATVVRVDGALDRAAMRALAFSDPALRARLEGILHPMIRKLSIERCNESAAPYVLLAIPLLVETGGRREWCKRVLVVDCPESLQIRRVMQRSGLAESEVRRIIASQATRAERLAAADDVIVNDGDFTQLDAEVQALHRKYLAMASA